MLITTLKSRLVFLCFTYTTALKKPRTTPFLLLRFLVFLPRWGCCGASQTIGGDISADTSTHHYRVVTFVLTTCSDVFKGVCSDQSTFIRSFCGCTNKQLIVGAVYSPPLKADQTSDFSLWSNNKYKNENPLCQIFVVSDFKCHTYKMILF